MQLMGQMLGGEGLRSHREFGKAGSWWMSRLLFSASRPVHLLDEPRRLWTRVPSASRRSLHRQHAGRDGFAGHPQVRRAVPPGGGHTERGTELLRNFLYKICGCAATGPTISSRHRPGDPRDGGQGGVVLGLSGSVDSVAACWSTRRWGSSWPHSWTPASPQGGGRK